MPQELEPGITVKTGCGALKNHLESWYDADAATGLQAVNIFRRVLWRQHFTGVIHMATMRILQVNSVDVQIMPGDKPQAVITVQGVAGTPGWTNVRLEPLEKKLSADGIFDMEFVGDPPDGIVIQVLTPVSASFVMKSDVERLVGVKVEARTNSVFQLVAQPVAAQQAVGPAGLTPVPGGPVPKTFPIFEENPKTFFFGEEDPSTFPRWEEFKTLAQFEENPKTLLIVEEQKPVFGETDPRVDDPAGPFGNTGPVGEDFGFRNPFGQR